MTKVSNENSLEESSNIEQQNKSEAAEDKSSLTTGQVDTSSLNSEQISSYSPRQIIM